jgi:hypothetical protein
VEIETGFVLGDLAGRQVGLASKAQTEGSTLVSLGTSDLGVTTQCLQSTQPLISLITKLTN